MAKKKKWIVIHTRDGRWVKKSSGTRTVTVHSTREEAVEEARRDLNKAGIRNVRVRSHEKSETSYHTFPSRGKDLVSRYDSAKRVTRSAGSCRFIVESDDERTTDTGPRYPRSKKS